MRLHLLPLALTVGAAPVGLADPAPGTVLTLEQAVHQALEHNARLESRRDSAEADRDDAKATRGRLLPQVSVSANYYNASSPESIDLEGLLGAAGTGASGSTSLPPLTLHGFGLGLGIVTASQPLLGLWHLSHELASANERADASQAELREQRADLRQQVEGDLLSLFEARALEGIAKASQAELREQRTVAQAKVEHGVATQGDLLRVEVAIANASEQQIEAEVQEKAARAALLTLLGLPTRSPDVDFAEPTELGQREVPTEAAQAEAVALAHRADVASAELQRDAAHHGFVASELKLLPEIDATAMYVRLQGLPSALPPDYFTAGFSLSWALWDSGNAYYQSRAAGARADAAAAAAVDARERVTLEVDDRLEEERAAAAAVSVAQEALRQAEEAFRVTAVTVKAGAATTTDLLDAQSALTQARLNLVRARYGQLRARSALTRALGVGT
ncbi:MAG TPA: TolC family protein [Myxococcales bacterium]|nr:TolC family protein [Myxococcales bacterium]